MKSRRWHDIGGLVTQDCTISTALPDYETA